MKELWAYYTWKNLERGFVIGLGASFLFIALGSVHSVWVLFLFLAFVTLATPAVMARNDAIRKWEEENFVDRM